MQLNSSEMTAKFLILCNVLVIIVDMSQAQLILLGTIEGKTFYWESRNPPRTWDEAAASCEIDGLRLASIETINQTQFLARAIYVNEGFLSHSWTAGTERRSLENFHWSNTETSFDEEAIPNFEYWESSNHYCVSLFVGSTSFTYYADDCSKAKTAILCELW